MSTLYLIWWLSIDSYNVSPYTCCGPHTLAVVKVLIIYSLQTSSNPFDVWQIHHTKCVMVWYSMVWCGVVWYGIVWCGMVWYSVVWYGIVWYGIVWYSVLWYMFTLYGL